MGAGAGEEADLLMTDKLADDAEDGTAEYDETDAT